MPGYLLYLWAWARLFGISEIALRLANIPWALLFTASLAWGVESVLNIRRAWLIICLSPFVWFYMNEARPYAMVMGLSMVTTIAVLAYARDPQRFRLAPWWAMLSLLALWSAHMLAIVLAPSLFLFLCVMRPVPLKKFTRQWFFPFAVTLPFFICLALYYLWTFAHGKGGMIEKPGLLNLVFAMYEFLGFGGLGPPRNVLRQSPNIHTLLHYSPSFGLGVLAFGIVIVAIILNLRRSDQRRTVFGLFIAFAAGLLSMLTLSYAVHFRILGRHVAFFFPLLALLLLAGLQAGSQRRRGRLAVCVLLPLAIAWSVSDLRQRLLPSYEKDDYRDATALALNALGRGEPVLWLADTNTARYYGLRTTAILKPGITEEPGAAAATTNCSLDWFQHALKDNGSLLVVMSDKYDIFDSSGNCRRALQNLHGEHVANYPAFDAWRVQDR
jgi:hypothetical protein